MLLNLRGSTGATQFVSAAYLPEVLPLRVRTRHVVCISTASCGAESIACLRARACRRVPQAVWRATHAALGEAIVSPAAAAATDLADVSLSCMPEQEKAWQQLAPVLSGRELPYPIPLQSQVCCMQLQPPHESGSGPAAAMCGPYWASPFAPEPLMHSAYVGKWYDHTRCMTDLS